MPDPTHYRATLAIRAFGSSPDELADRIRRVIETHPTLSFPLDEVVVREARTSLVDDVWCAIERCFDLDVEDAPSEDDGYEGVHRAVLKIGHAPETDDEIDMVLTHAFGAQLRGGQDEYARRRTAYRNAFVRRYS